MKQLKLRDFERITKVLIGGAALAALFCRARAGQATRPPALMTKNYCNTVLFCQIRYNADKTRIFRLPRAFCRQV